MKNSLLVAIVIFLLHTTLAAQQPVQSPERNTEQQLPVYFVDNNYPFSYTLSDGTITGLYVDIWRLWSRYNNQPIDIRLMGVKEALEQIKLNPGVHSGLFKTAQRAEWATFSMPYHHIRTGILLPFDIEPSKSLSDFKGLTIAVFKDTYQHQLVTQNYPNLDLVLVEESANALTLLREGKIHGLVGEIPFLEGLIMRNQLQGVLHLSEQVIDTQQVYAVTSQEFSDLIDWVDRGFKEIPVKDLIELEKKWLPAHEPFFKDMVDFTPLTLKEKKWLQYHNNFSRGIENVWSPFEFRTDSNEVLGIASDFLELISERLNITFNPDYSRDWNSAYEKLQNDELDIVSTIIHIPEREQHTLFTKPYFSTQTVIVTRKDSFFVSSLDSLRGKSLGLLKNYALSQLVARDYPDIKIVDIDSLVEGLQKVQSKEIDATMNVGPAINRALHENDFDDLIVAAASPYNFEISIGVRKGLAPLIPILNKAIDDISLKEKARIENTWLPIQINKGEQLRDILIWLIPVMGTLLLVIFYIARINNKLSVEIEHRKQSEKERRELEKQLHHSQKMEALGKLTGGIAHDFNNMLGIIMGYSELLKSAAVDNPRINNYAKQIHTAGERGVKLTQKLLSISKKRSISDEVININQCLFEQRDMLQKTLTVLIKVDLNMDNNLWNVLLDRADLEDSILNLSINAMHAMEQVQQPVLRIETKNIPADDADRLNSLPEGDFVRLSITDNGCGMDADVKQQIFEPFYSTKGDKGSGLGLSQVFGFVSRSSGHIEVNSKLGEGTEFHLYFPKYQGITASDSNETQQTTDQVTGHETILIIDDEPALQNLTAEILNHQGYRCLQCDSGDEALQLLRETAVDLVISDIIMPNMNGFDLAALIKADYPAVKIILVSGYSRIEHSAHRPLKEYDDLITKPYDSNDLLRRIRQLLDNKN